jgi:molybdopterin-containing oxidoreductase family iron-sulfur binding subunit
MLAFVTANAGDGSGANRAWLQEIPNTLTTAVWGSWVEVNPKLADKLSLKQGEVVQLITPNGSINAPVFVSKYVHPDVVAVPVGQGHSSIGRFGDGVGANPLSILSASKELPEFVINNVLIRKDLSRNELVITQMQNSELKRGIVRSVSLTKLTKKNDSHHKASHDEGSGHGGGHHDPYALGPQEAPKQMYKQMDPPLYRWGMSIDLSKCTGCSACVVACYAENNVPVVGKELCAEGREMSWLKIDRYFDGPDDRPVTGFMPMLCQHCGNAPCEPVCPVYATYHNEEGLNAMLYNRCVGTRYCGNNCSYKVRRFNWFKYDWQEPLNMQLNPDVTVREVGIMEKCSFCVQRIREAQGVAKDHGRPVRDGEVQPACSQSCPTQAIKFGNLLDKESAVFADSQNARAYKVLDSQINTQPAISYLAKIDNDSKGNA